MSRTAATGDLVVDTLSARLVGVPASPQARRWLDRTAGSVAHEHLPRALSDAALPAGHWFVPRVDLALRCHGVIGLPAFADDWSRAIVDSIAASLAQRSGWLHFSTDVELVAAMLTAVMTGDTEHDWVWARAGLPLDELSGSPATRVLAALRLHPDVALAALVRAASTCGLATLDLALGETGWDDVAVALGISGAPDPGARAHRSPTRSPDASPEDLDWRARALLDGSAFGRQVLSSRLRPAHRTATTWARIVVGEVEPALLVWGGPHVELVRGLVERRLGTHVPAAGPVLPPVVPGPGSDATDPAHAAPGLRTGAAGDTATPPGVTDDDVTPDAGARAGTDRAPSTGDATTDAGPGPGVGDEPVPATAHPAGSRADTDSGGDHGEGVDGIRTSWAGLVHLLATASAAGLPDCVDADAVLAPRGVRWSVWRCGIALTHAALDDAAVLALCGLGAEQADVVLDHLPATPGELRAVARLAAQWRRTTLERLRRAPFGVEEVPASEAAAWSWLVHRPGRVVATPGWVDVVLPLEGVDTAVRSAGLDLDAGYVPWLGTVVRLRHE